ncbi:kinase-like domain-containing protein [Emericellopsis atlantica]|uniref:Kinase-like domain-containing protein n=1 Tax=Emericellopsis atlantica TaxID=2614577 RepID=A0A9P7ZRG4_9HYPO|nr:kinase-like domain-containing protein [Emericellopsis atlantica]KAG9256969.1 kinase-like domain-containing protein [Emericellopsis atlantica]
MPPVEDDVDEDFRPRLLSKQPGVTIIELDPGMVRKYGDGVTRNEEAALRVVKEKATVPVPELHGADYFIIQGEEHGSFLMDLTEGCTLRSQWDSFGDSTKDRICREIWGIVEQLRRIPPPASFSHLFQCGADGSPSQDVLLRDLHDPPAPIETDDVLRARIYERYLHYNGGSFPENLPDHLPRSSASVFTHGELKPRNIMVDSSGGIAGILNWELAGWYPDYWELCKYSAALK